MLGSGAPSNDWDLSRMNPTEYRKTRGFDARERENLNECFKMSTMWG
jgi:hypothetical protein